jgi:hypothetical protein
LEPTTEEIAAARAELAAAGDVAHRVAYGHLSGGVKTLLAYAEADALSGPLHPATARLREADKQRVLRQMAATVRAYDELAAGQAAKLDRSLLTLRSTVAEVAERMAA